MVLRAWFGRVVMAMAGLGLAAAVGTAAIAAPTVKGDAAAYNEMVAAVVKLNALPGYRLKVTTTDGTTAFGEYAFPNSRWHEKIQAKEASFETFAVGNEAVTRSTGPGSPGGGCQKGTLRMGGPALIYQDPRDFKGEITVTRKPDTVIDGTPVRAYALISVTPSGYRTTGDLYIGTQSGLPRRAMSIDATDKGPRTTTYDFYDYEAKITIALPNC